MEDPPSISVGERNKQALDLLRQLEQAINLGSSRSEILEYFEDICRIITPRMLDFLAELQQSQGNGGEETESHLAEVPFSNEVVGLLCTLSVRLCQEGIFLEMLSFDFQKMPRPSRAETSLFPAIGMGFFVFGPGTLEPNLTLNLTRVLSFGSRCTIIDLITEGFKTARLSLRDSEASESGDDNGDYSSAPALSRANSYGGDVRNERLFYRWVESHYKWALAHCPLLEDDDFAQLMRAGIILDKNNLWREIILIVEKQMSTPGHLLSFMEAFFQCLKEQQIPNEMGLDTFRMIFYSLHEQLNQPLINHTAYQNTDDLKIASILYHCLKHELYPEFDQMTTQILLAISTAPTNNLNTIILPLTTNILSHFLTHNIPLNTPRVLLLFQQTLTVLRRRYIGRQPEEPSSWARPWSSCTCTHCLEFNAFLTDPLKYEIRITKSFPVRIHLENQLTFDGGEDEFRFEHEMKGAIHSLLVSKNIISKRYEREYEAWRIRNETVSLRFLELGVEPLKELFGDRVDAVFNLKDDDDGTAAAAAVATAQVDAEQRGMVSGWGVDGDDDDEEVSDAGSDIVFLRSY